MPDSIPVPMVAVALGALVVGGVALLAMLPSAAPADESGPWTVQVVTAFNASAYGSDSEDRSDRADLPPGTPAVNGTLDIDVTKLGGSMDVGHTGGSSRRQSTLVDAQSAEKEPSEEEPMVGPATGEYEFGLGPDGRITVTVAEGARTDYFVGGEVPDPPEDCRARYRSEADRVRIEPGSAQADGTVVVDEDLTVHIPFAVKCVPRNVS